MFTIQFSDLNPNFMKKILLFSVLITLVQGICAQEGKVFDNLSLNSKILKGERNYAVYLPPGYEQSERSYPVLYLLHGYTDNHTGWVQFGEVAHITDKAIREGKSTAMIIIMPDADTGQPGYNNTIDGKWNYEKFFFDELMPEVENKFRIKKEKRFRAISGLSMGGGGTFLYALHRPDLFASACPLSAWMGPQTAEELAGFQQLKNKELSTEELENYLKINNPLQLVESMNEKDLNSVRWYIDCGDDDFLFEGNSLMHIALSKKKINHEYRVRDGGHTWTYWRDSLPEVLAFVSAGFHQY